MAMNQQQLGEEDMWFLMIVSLARAKLALQGFHGTTQCVGSQTQAYGASFVCYEFLGRVLGKAVYKSMWVELQFCLPFLNQLLGKTNVMEDLYYKNLNKLRHMNDSEIAALGLTFEMTLGGSSKSPTAGSDAPPRAVELMPGDRSIAVRTKAHVFQYMHAVTNQLLKIICPDGRLTSK
jgi:hypothetical protein